MEKKKSTEYLQSLKKSIVQNVNIKEIFTEEELNIILDEFYLIEDKSLIDQKRGSNPINSNDSRKKNTIKINGFICDRSYFILNVLKMSSDKLKNNNLEYLAKAVDWIQSEINESLLFRFNETLMKTFEKMKTEDKDLETVLDWLEEFSTIKIGRMDSKRKSLGFKDFISKSDLSDESNNSPINNAEYLNISDENISKIEENDFNIFELEKQVGQKNILSLICSYVFTSMGFYSFINYTHFDNFVQEMVKGYYRENPYHNDLHAADVVHTCMVYLKRGNISNILKLDDYEISSVLIACLIHDFKHPGITNMFLINTSHPIAIKYNDKSVLENYHVSQSFKIINNNPKCNIFIDMSKDAKNHMRKKIIECVISTDMTFHTEQFHYLKLKREHFNIIKGKNSDKIVENLESISLTKTKQEFLNILIHASDISNPTKPFEVYSQWADKVMAEFFAQGDKEKELGLPCSFLCNRDTVTIPNAQIGFIDGIVYPFFETLTNIFIGLEFLIENIKNNKEEYKKLKI